MAPEDHVMSDTPAPVVVAPPPARATSSGRSLPGGALLVALLGGALLIDAAVETFAGGSPVRWWAALTAAMYGAVTVLTFRKPFNWRTRLTIALVGLLGLIAAAAWRPDGLSHGIYLLGQSTPRVLSSLTAAALVLGIVVLMRATQLPLFVRLVFAFLATYGVAAFAVAAWDVTSYDALFAGESAWRIVPRWLQGAVVGGLVALPLALGVSLLGGLARGRRSWGAQQIVALALTLAIVISGFMGAAGVAPSGIRLDLGAVNAADSTAPSDAADPPDQRTTADAVALVKNVTAGPPPSTFDVDRKADEIGGDPAALFAYVHDHIRTEIYPGVLRGAQATLMGGAGNAWDQALLLAALLRHHRRDVRFARAHLSSDQAAKVVDAMFAEALRTRPAATQPGVPESIQRQGRAMLARIQTNWRRAHGDVLQALAQARLNLGDNAATEKSLAAEAVDHVWVEYRDGSRWVALDPVLAARPGDAPAASAETFAEVPDALYHQITISVKTEERRNQKLEAKVALRYSTTAAAVNGVPVAIFQQIDHDIAGRWRAMPVIMVGNTPYGALRFTDAGVESVVVTKKGDLIAQAHQSIGQLGLVTDQFGDDKPSNPAAPSELSAVWLEFAFRDPAGHTEVTRRVILDRIGFAARVEQNPANARLAPVAMNGDVPTELAGVYGCAFTSGPIDPMLTMRTLSSRSEVMALTSASQQPNVVPAASDPRVTRTLDALPTVLWTAAAGVHVLSQQLAARLRPSGGRPTVFYEATPRLAIASVEIIGPPAASSARFSFALDLRRNAVRVAAPGTAAADLVRANLARGILDGAIEDALAAHGSGSSRARVLSAVLLSQAGNQRVDLVATADRSAIPTLHLPDEARARLEDALGDHKAFVVSRQPTAVDSTPREAWWDVDLSSGETIGVIDSGLHGASPFAEEATIDARVISPFARTLGTFPPPAPPVVYVNSAPMFALGLGLGIFVMGAAIFLLSTFQNPH